MGKDSITDYSKTQRIVLLIDLNPLLYLSDSTPYITTLLSSIKIILSFPPLSSSLFSFKPFFSSLSPLLSSSKLPSFSSSGFLSFDLHEPTLSLLSRFFVSLKETPISSNSKSAEDTLPRGVHVAASMRQLVHEYLWDLLVLDPVMGKVLGCDDSVSVSSNLVVLFSPICRDFEWLAAFFNLGTDDQCLKDLGLFKLKFRGIFGSVNDAFVSRDIHFSWVDVKFESGSTQTRVEIGDCGSTFGFFDSGIRDLGWGFCSTDSIVLGSALLPFGLIYPRMGISSYSFRYNELCKRVHVQLSLEILDVKGKPLQCKCCELELIVPRIFHDNSLDGSMNLQNGYDEKMKRSLEGIFCDEITKLHIKALRRYDECVKIEDHLYNKPITVYEFLGEFGSDKKGKSGELHVERILQILATEMGECNLRKSVPIWNILLSFLYREGYWALVMLSSDNECLCMGLLKPFTVSSALLSIVDDEFYSQNMVHELGGGEMPLTTKADFVIGNSNADPKPSRLLDSKSRPASHGKHTAQNSDKRKTCRKNLHLLQNLTWDAFCESVSDNSVYLEEIYFAMECDNLKKLKFMKCWMKQIKKSSSYRLVITRNSNPCEDIPKELETRVEELLQESEQSIPLSASLGDNSNCLVEISKMQERDTLYYHSETLESFFCSLADKIKQGVASEEVNAGALADRLVNSSIFWLNQKFEKKIESEIPVPKIEEACGGMVAGELTRLLLREPKELALMHKKNDPSSTASDSKNLIREYELQILFRMEILKSEVGVNIEEPVKQKFVKHICLLLEAIQCHLEGGFFGDWSLETYAEKTIKNRYCSTLGDVVQKIYTKMDLLVFTEEDGSPNNLLNSEDSNQSWREKQERDQMSDGCRVNQSVSVRKGFHQLQEYTDENCQGIERVEHACKLMEAQERRERARRFASFTSWMPDLQRVWAPRHTKEMKVKLRKLSKRKGSKSTSCYDMVCETPLTGNKRSNEQVNCSGDKEHHSSGIKSGVSVSKVLFRD